MVKQSSGNRPTLRDIAEIVNLSPRAVSQALRDRKGNVKVCQATKERVLKVAAELGYRQNRAARALRTGRTGQLGILSFQGQDVSSARLLYHAVQAAEQKGHIPVVYHADRQHAQACLEACYAMIDSNVDGVLLLSPSEKVFTQKNVQLLQQAGIKVVSINAPWLEHIPCFIQNKQHGFEELARHLVAEGNRSITLATWDIPPALPRWRHFHARAAQEAFRIVAEEYPQVCFRVFPISLLDGFGEKIPCLGDIHPLQVAGYVTIRRLMESGKLPDALMFQVDSWVLGALRACGEADIHVPRDISFTGFEDDPYSAGGYVPITTVSQPTESLCQLALKELGDLIREEKEHIKLLTMIDGELIIRQSSIRRPLPPPDPSTLSFK